ncbi:MAG: Uma2 family endonuclease [Bacteroidales bacterium]|nr:Uma2 family endonuclease [Bacteroidales bacterium]
MPVREMASQQSLLPIAPPSDLLRLSVHQYHQMVEAGILTEQDRYELLSGCIVARKTIHPPHAYVIGRLFRRLNTLLPDDWLLNTQLPITLQNAKSELFPDLAIVRGPDTLYKHRHPGAGDSEISVEVADSLLERDHTVKMAIYATAKIPQYWIVNLPARCVEVYTQPRGGKSPQYRTRTDYPADATLPVILAGQALGSVTVAEILP